MREETDDRSEDEPDEQPKEEPDPGGPWAKFSTGRDPHDDDGDD